LIDIISSLFVLLFNLCFTFTNNRRIVTYVKRVALRKESLGLPQVRALRMSGVATVLKTKRLLDSNSTLNPNNAYKLCSLKTT